MNIAKTLFATGLMGLMAAAASAQSIPDIGGISNADATQEGDLILGFTNASVTSEMLVDVGPADYYYSSTNALGSQNPNGALTPGTTYAVSAYTAASLTTAFGANAYTSSTFWGVVGGNGSAGGPGSENAKTLWLTGSALTSQTQANQSSLSISLDGMTNNASGASSIAGGSVDAGTQAKNTATSFTTLMGNGNFGFNEGSLVASTANSLSGTTALELYELLPSNANSSGGSSKVDLGTFDLTSSGLTFTSFAAIPEPSTYAAILGALTIGFVMIRRRSQSASLDVLG